MDCWYECFITKDHNFCLLDDSNVIRATAYDLKSIVSSQTHYGWGKIHRMLRTKDGIVIEKCEVK